MYELITSKFGYTFIDYDELVHFLVLNTHKMKLEGEIIREIHTPKMILQYSLGSTIKLPKMPTIYNI